MLTFQGINTEKNEHEETVIIQNINTSHVNNGEPSTTNKEDNMIRRNSIHTDHSYCLPTEGSEVVIIKEKHIKIYLIVIR